MENFLRKRANEFFVVAKSLFEQGFFALSAFNIEQFCQLYIKAKLFDIVGDFPKTHSLKNLFVELANITNENIDVIGNIEKSYVTSRYFPEEFSKEEVKNMITFAEKLKRLTDEL